MTNIYTNKKLKKIELMNSVDTGHPGHWPFTV